MKSNLRLLLYIVLILIASLGIGIAGGVPIPQFFKRNERSNDNI